MTSGAKHPPVCRLSYCLRHVKPLGKVPSSSHESSVFCIQRALCTQMPHFAPCGLGLGVFSKLETLLGPRFHQVMNLAAFVLYSPRAYNIARTKKSNKANITRRVYPHRSVCLSMLTFRFIPPFQMQFIVGHMQGLSPCRRACALTSIYNNSLGTRHDIRGFTQSYRKCTHWATDNCNCYGDVTEATPPK